VQIAFQIGMYQLDHIVSFAPVVDYWNGEVRGGFVRHLEEAEEQILLGL